VRETVAREGALNEEIQKSQPGTPSGVRLVGGRQQLVSGSGGGNTKTASMLHLWFGAAEEEKTIELICFEHRGKKNVVTEGAQKPIGNRVQRGAISGNGGKVNEELSVLIGRGEDGGGRAGRKSVTGKL